MREITNSSIWPEAVQPVGGEDIYKVGGSLAFFHRCFGKLMEKLNCKQDNVPRREKYWSKLYCLLNVTFLEDLQVP